MTDQATYEDFIDISGAAKSVIMATRDMIEVDDSINQAVTDAMSSEPQAFADLWMLAKERGYSAGMLDSVAAVMRACECREDIAELVAINLETAGYPSAT